MSTSPLNYRIRRSACVLGYDVMLGGADVLIGRVWRKEGDTRWTAETYLDVEKGVYRTRREAVAALTGGVA